MCAKSVTATEICVHCDLSSPNASALQLPVWASRYCRQHLFTMRCTAGMAKVMYRYVPSAYLQTVAQNLHCDRHMLIRGSFSDLHRRLTGGGGGADFGGGLGGVESCMCAKIVIVTKTCVHSDMIVPKASAMQLPVCVSGFCRRSAEDISSQWWV